MRPLKGSFTLPTTWELRGPFILTQASGGRSASASFVKSDGSMISIPESANGIAGPSVRFTARGLSEINSVIESYISTELIPSLAKLSLGDLRALSPKYVLEVRYSFVRTFPGSSFCCKYTIRLCSKSQSTGGEKLILSIPLDAILRFLFPTQIPL
jgi:hypothetical protein